ncbi:mitochondrial organizing structure protein 2 [Geosmithia morbida]|uniref:MICOS complex subunit n=1 Tax=Geosmithia morbida TaxID=1094350 RepID=A0A9P5D4G9_9HYPO|nr:mitochondrial organizing structure protein 2 [Geosmithia morbida]KAF4123526.1 mitochondrial organizing structure protein 2 [Geosmithia morbida]
MAARVLLQRRSLATMALGGMALAPATVYAEAPQSYKACRPTPERSYKLFRKSIYDDVAAEVVPANAAPAKEAPARAAATQEITKSTEGTVPERRPTPTDRLAVQIGNARLFLHKYVAAAEDRVNEMVDSAFSLERSFTGTLASLAPPRDSGEKLMPGSIYVIVAAMAGSIVTRNRNILLRATAPLALGVGAAWTVLPITMRNVSDLAWEYEKRVPAVADAHIQTREGIEKAISFAKVHKEVGLRLVNDKVTEARETVEGWVRQGK